MNGRKQIISCEEIRKTDMADHLSCSGHKPKKIIRADYWYLFHYEWEKRHLLKLMVIKIAGMISGIGKGGNIIDFAIFYYGYTVVNF